MSQTLPVDPFKIWKEIYNKTESTFSEAIQETLGKEAFSEGLGHTLDGYLQYQEFVTKTAESYLAQFNMPTRTEVANVASLVINMENKIDQLEEQIEQLAEESTKEVNSLKRTITNLDKKLDRVLSAVEKDEKAAASTKKK